jgi:hypothetical protein
MILLQEVTMSLFYDILIGLLAFILCYAWFMGTLVVLIKLFFPFYSNEEVARRASGSK